jgi:hypothetical protein
MLLRYYSVLVLSTGNCKRFVKLCDAIGYVAHFGISIIVKGDYLPEFFQRILERTGSTRGKNGIRPGIKT